MIADIVVPVLTWLSCYLMFGLVFCSITVLYVCCTEKREPPDISDLAAIIVLFPVFIAVLLEDAFGIGR